MVGSFKMAGQFIMYLRSCFGGVKAWSKYNTVTLSQINFSPSCLQWASYFLRLEVQPQGFEFFVPYKNFLLMLVLIYSRETSTLCRMQDSCFREENDRFWIWLHQSICQFGLHGKWKSYSYLAKKKLSCSVSGSYVGWWWHLLEITAGQVDNISTLISSLGSQRPFPWAPSSGLTWANTFSGLCLSAELLFKRTPTFTNSILFLGWTSLVRHSYFLWLV
jgi:hypothetical protein